MSFGFYSETNKLLNSNSVNNINNMIDNNKDFEDSNIQLSSQSSQSSLPLIKPKIYKKLKSSLKLSSSSRNNSLTSTISNSSIHSSLSCNSSNSSSSHKSVRFAPELTTVKKFCSTDKPSFISSRTLENKNYSNYLIPLDENLESSKNNNSSNDFNNKIINSQFLPSFSNNNNNNFQLDYDSDSSIDDDDFSYNLNQRLDFNNDDTDSMNSNQNNIIIDNSNSNTAKVTTNSLDSFDVLDWNLINTNLIINNNNNIDNMNNQNIKLHSIEQIKDSNNKKTDEIIGTIYVNNLTFEKFIEIKFTFTNWSDIHYVTATYNKSINDNIDEFKFIINLSSFKYFLKLDNLLFSNTQSNLPTNCPLKIEFCCRYDVNNETYYDNNNYSNYELSIIARTINLVPNENFNPIYKTKKSHEPNTINQKSFKKSFYSDFLVSTTLSHKIHLLNNFKSTSQKNAKRQQPTITRRFSEDTDYYNTSPLKHLYHNDTTPIRPTSLNRVLTPSNEQTTEVNNTTNTLGYPSNNPYNCSDDVAQLSSFQPFTYTATPSLSSSLSSSLSDLPQLDDYTYFLTNENDEVPENLEQFQYNPNYNFAESFTRSFNQIGSDSDGTEVPTNINNRNNNNNETIDNDTINEHLEYIDPLNNSNFNDDTRSIITDTPQNTFINNSTSRYLTPPENIIFQNNNNSNETLINHKLALPRHEQQLINDTLTPTNIIPQISTIRSETVDEPSPSSSSSESSSNSSSFLSASNELENRRSSNLSSQIANTMTISTLSGINESVEPRALNYQTLLNSYCFFTSDNKPTIHKSKFTNKKKLANKDNPKISSSSTASEILST